MAHPGTLHQYTKKLVAFEHASPSRPSSSPPPPNTLLWIGGLTDGLLTVHYPSAIAAALPPHWRLAEVLTSSSYAGWATGSLERDAKEIGRAVEYFKDVKGGKDGGKKEEGKEAGKIILMGHSTGCQDVMEYLTGKDHDNRHPINGAILQAAVSDREAWDDMASSDPVMRTHLDALLHTATALVEEGNGAEILPSTHNPLQDSFGAPVSAYRAWSLLAKGGDDDFFSTDLGDAVLERSFGRIPAAVRVLLVWGERDEYLPKGVHGVAVLGRWAGVVAAGGAYVDEVNGGVIPGASHNLNRDPESVVQDLVGRVVRFVQGLEDADGAGVGGDVGGDGGL
ncbi:DUF1749-domain-containing protein [Massarina eburnea CBS 473.64]|uniref:DUF1749-domain-containing protein n=1 Tax=Massarina eburnea CBS 473.64 TaxID=1395130 RepID=A0A6A6S9W1_9PLEO|nr:DUF1749-domain-containing protein [Massarina eburnea CBS 473.64]